jgi:hypothetical protein
MNQYLFIARVGGLTVAAEPIDTFTDYKPVRKCREKAETLARTYNDTIMWELFRIETIGERFHFTPSFHSSALTPEHQAEVLETMSQTTQFTDWARHTEPRTGDS